ncbi:hypothetical protein CCAN2_1610014 [Capnocytophaga canimorsus]|nr:hypothetical protein CCAN2_1610014 [Capnocytophaga canimorsus]
MVPERVEKTQKILDEAQVPRAAEYSGSLDAWKALCERDDVDFGVYCYRLETPRSDGSLRYGTRKTRCH